MSKSVAADILGEFGRSIGIPELRFDDRNACSLIFDADILVNIGLEVEQDRLVLFSYLGDLSRAIGGRQCAAMLEGNFFWRGTGGATLSLETASGGALLMQAVPLSGLRAGLFHDMVESFVNMAEYWMGRLRDLEGSADDRSTRSAEQHAPMGLRV